ncbi:hypothetical protein B484DRAFT_411933 [Ochromonadaceae sp. CCMP2298]|nr:hypothetical protein B484DRAFT_411933 [Ochromonadaceae sp. CCMP2298]
MSDAAGLAMEQLLSILYCRSVFSDFRKPVAVAYPHLIQTYRQVIERPMDLGTLLLGALRRELNVSQLRDGLQLVHFNALTFNAGASQVYILYIV